MIKRALWLGVGIAVGVVVARKLTQAAQAYSPSGLAGSARNSAAGLLGSMRDFIADVRDGMAEREEQIHDAFARGVSLEDMDDDDPYFGMNQNGAGTGR
jgi:hypothetical protein